MPVNTPRADYDKMLPKWQRLRDCSDGRDAILKAGNKYVPDLPGQDMNGNKAYRERGNFYNAVSRTVQGMNGAIFQEPPEVEISETFQAMLDDITLTNVPFESFATETGKEIFKTGRYGVLIDMPVAPKPTPENPTPVAIADIDMRPYCVGYRAEDIINWRTERRGGDEVLTMVVLEEYVDIPKADDPFTCDVLCQYRVVMLVDNKCVRQLWRQKVGEPKNFEMVDEVTLMRRGEALDYVPFVFMGALNTSPDLELPPLIDLADVNIGHWRNSVDHEYGLHLIALPTPWVAGAKGGDNSGKMKIGPAVVWELDLQGSAGMLEFTGSGLASLVAAMDEKKKQMATLGARLLEDAPTTAETAAAVKLRHGGETASLRTVAQSLEAGFTQILQMCIWWAGTDDKPVDADVNVELNKEYLNIRATPQEIQVALTALQAGEISFDTWYDILQKGGWAREGVTSEDEQKTIAKQKPRAPEPVEDPALSPAA